MSLWEGVLIAVASVWANKLRSFFTVLGNIIAVAFIIAVVSAIHGINAEVQSSLADKGVDVVRLRQHPLAFSRAEYLRSLRNPKITVDDAAGIRKEVPLAAAVSCEVSRRTSVSKRGKRVEQVGVYGRSHEYVVIDPETLAAGRHLAPFDVARRRQVAVLGKGVAQELFGGENALGKSVLIGGRHFEVVGVGEEQGALMGNTQDDWVVIPITTFCALYGSRHSARVKVKAADPLRVREVLEQVTVVMRKRHRLRPGEENDFGVYTSDAILDLYESTTRSIYTVLVAVVALALVVGGIVIANIMLAVVNERTREIGVRKAIGARRRDILWQFLVEACTLSVLGGLVGIAAGTVFAWGIRTWTPLPTQVQAWSVGVGILMVVVVGGLAGLGPALRASQLNPVEALRYE